jgi:hypothetical protein
VVPVVVICAMVRFTATYPDRVTGAAGPPADHGPPGGTVSGV